MEILGIMFAVITALVLISLGLLYMNGGKYTRNNLVFFIIALISVIISWIAFSSLPNNYTVRRIIATAWGIMALAAVLLKKNKKTDRFTMARIVLTVSLVGGLANMFLNI